MRVNQHGLQGFQLKISKMNKWRTILAIFCVSESIASIIPNVATFSKNLTLQEAFETATQINEELKRTEFLQKFKLKLLANQKKNRGH